MICNRRDFLVDGGSVAALLAVGFLPKMLTASEELVRWQENWFDETNSIDDTFLALGIKRPQFDERVVVDAPDTAENGAYVGVSVSSAIPNIVGVALLVEKNPSTLAGYFQMKRAKTLNFATKIKMAETSDLLILVKADEQYFINRRNIKVILGGCGS